MRIRAAFAVVAVCLTLPVAASAKGASQATIEGPGIDKITIGGGGNGDPGPNTPLGALAERGGFFPAVFRRSPDPMLAARPAGKLGPRYTVTYVMPGPNGEDSTIRQFMYPYAAGGPVTYTPPGQVFWGGERSRGGWFVADSALRETLHGIGLPAAAPNADGGSGTDWLRWFAAAVAVAGLGAAALLAARRLRLRPSPAT